MPDQTSKRRKLRLLPPKGIRTPLPPQESNAKCLRTKTLHYCIVDSAPRLPLTLLKVEKIICKNIRFVLLLSFSPSFPTSITQNLQGVYERSTYTTNALLLEIFLFWFKAACKLQLVSYGPKHTSWCLSDTLFCVYFKYNSKTMGCLRLYYAPNDSSTTEMLHFLQKQQGRYNLQAMACTYSTYITRGVGR